MVMRSLITRNSSTVKPAPPLFGCHRTPAVEPLDDADASRVVDSPPGLRYEYGGTILTQSTGDHTLAAAITGGVFTDP